MLRAARSILSYTYPERMPGSHQGQALRWVLLHELRKVIVVAEDVRHIHLQLVPADALPATLGMVSMLRTASFKDLRLLGPKDCVR